MIEASSPFVLGVLLIGLVAIAATPLRAGLARLGIPDVVGYIAIGVTLAVVDSKARFLTGETRHGLDMLAAAGIVVLLFRAGLESHPNKLMRQLPRASFALFGNVLASAVLGYAATRYVIGTDVLPAVFVAIALSATSVGVSVAVWRDAGVLDTDRGALLLDLAELDDVASVVLLAVILALAPVLNGGHDEETVPQLLVTAGWLAVKLIAFGVACLLFATHLEQRITRWFGRLDHTSAPIIPVVGFAFVIAAISDQLGFTLAIGALAAGLAFSRDPKRVRLDRHFDTLFRLFVPFFFIGIGLAVPVDALPTALTVGGVLLVVAVVTKIAGTALPLVGVTGGAGALLIGVSMIPRAEIAMVVMERGRMLGDWAVPDEIYGGMVVVTLATCLLTPLAVTYLLRREKQRNAP